MILLLYSRQSKYSEIFFFFFLLALPFFPSIKMILNKRTQS